jgi:hypothetical protein
MEHTVFGPTNHDETVRCEYCGSDVSTKYKAVHDEVEMINGIPSPCRNNGKRNVDIWNPLKRNENEVKG